MLIMKITTTSLIVAGLLTNNAHALHQQEKRRGLMDQNEAEAQREGLRDYFSNKRSGHVEDHTVTDSGAVIDWVSRGNTQTPPSFSSIGAGSEYDDWDNKEEFELEEQPWARGGVHGDVPCLRRDLMADYLSIEELPSCVDDFLCKYGTNMQVHRRELHPGGDLYQKFAGVRMEVDNHGVECYMSVNRPYVEESVHAEYSSAMMSVVSSDHRIEVGWQVSHAKYGDTYPHLYVYYTQDDDDSRGDNRGGYNLDVDGFVQYSEIIFPGDRLLTPSFPGDDQYSMFVRIEYVQDAWWIRINDEMVGYYPSSLVLGNQAQWVYMGGELRVLDDGNHHSQTDMGSGEIAENRWTNAAYIRNIKILETNGSEVDPGHHLEEYVRGINDDNCYSVFERFDSGNDWGTYFYYGGPGYGPGCQN